MWKTLGLLLMVASAQSPMTNAQAVSEYSAGQLLELCNHWVPKSTAKESINSAKGIACEYWIAGIIQGIKTGQAIRIVREYIKERAEGWHRPAGSRVYTALIWAFPCQES